MNWRFFHSYRVLVILAVLAVILIGLNIFDTDDDKPLFQNGAIIDNTRDKERAPTINSEQTRSKYSKGLPGQSCSSGQFVTGIDSNGKINCGAIDALSVSGSGQEQACYGHGFIEDGFCSCDEGWTGAYCEQPEKPRNKDAPPDNDFDNVPAPLDCDDNDDMVYPGAPDAVDGKDNDCDGEVDEGY